MKKLKFSSDYLHATTDVVNSKQANSDALIAAVAKRHLGDDVPVLCYRGLKDDVCVVALVRRRASISASTARSIGRVMAEDRFIKPSSVGIHR